MRTSTRSSQKYLLLGSKLLVGGSIFYFLFRAVFGEGFKAEVWLHDLWQAFKQGAGWPISIAFVLIFLNWGLEAWKWKKLAAKVESITLGAAFKAVLVGICLGFITPNRLGDYAGRIIELRTGQRLQAFGAIFLGRFCQLFWTVTGGSIGVLYFIFIAQKQYAGSYIGLTFSFLLLHFCFLIVLYHPRIITNVVAALPFLNRFKPYVAIVGLYTKSEISVLLGLSGLRYGVFVLQFGLLLYAFGVQISLWQITLGVASTFLLKSVVPSFSAVTDLGMRELSAMYFFSLLQQNKAHVMSASLSLWFLNIALPSLLGLLFVWRLKYKNLTLS